MVWYGMVDVCDGYLAAKASESSSWVFGLDFIGYNFLSSILYSKFSPLRSVRSRCCTFSSVQFSSVQMKCCGLLLRFTKGIYWATGLFLRTPFTEGCAGANKKASPPGRYQEQTSKQRCTFRPTTFSSVQFSSACSTHCWVVAAVLDF